MIKKQILTTYKLSTDKHLKLALVTDLHDRRSDWVISLLQKTKPDLICVAGDSFERFDLELKREKRTDRTRGFFNKLMYRFLIIMDDFFDRFADRNESSAYTYYFLKKAAEVAPVFFSLGNHEWFLTEKDHTVLQENGIILLDNADTVWHGIHIGGLSSDPDLKWLQHFAEEKGYRILLCHHPEYYEKYLQETDIDLILSGHAHGGQIRVFGHGIFAPGQGVFPRYHHGVYDERLVVSAGCANTASAPRWGNPCEVVILEL